MFPWVYEFQWSAGHLIFLGAFFTVLGTVLGSVVTAALRSSKDPHHRRSDALQWEADFGELPRAARACRHELTGEVRHRTCDHEFDCRTCDVHPRFEAAAASRPPAAAAPSDVLGFSMQADRLYHRGHTWVKPEGDGLYAIGLDDFGSRLLGPCDGVELPAPGTHLHANGTGWFVAKEDARVRILAPIDGVVVEQGGGGREWLLRVKADDAERSTRHLLRGAEIYPWIAREMERLEFALASGGVGPTLADGGELVPFSRELYPEADWEAVWGEVFLQA